MPLNTLEYASIFQTELDKQMIELSVTGALEVNSKMVKYNGGNEVKIPSIIMEGMTDYDRSTGFEESGVSLSWETHTLDQDRQKSFMLDAMDIDETNFVLSAGAVMGEFQSVHVAPEVDAYRFSRIAEKTADSARTLTLTKSNILTELKSDIAAVQDKIGEAEPLLIYMSYSNAALLDLATDIQKSLSVIEFKLGSINLKVKAIDEIPIIKVPSQRFKTKWIKGEKGYTFDEDSKEINWVIINPKVAPCITKTEKIRIFTPETNQKADAWKIDYRKYHGIILPKNKLNGIKVNLKG